MSENVMKTLDHVGIQEVLKLLPHRYPLLMVDLIRDIDRDNSCIGVKNVTFNEPHFQGHFPGQPIMPGVLIIEGMAQTAGAICVHSKTAIDAPKAVYFMTIDKVKFRKPVVPGDVLEYHMTKTKNRGNMWWYQGIAKVNGKTVAEAQVSAMLML